MKHGTTAFTLVEIMIAVVVLAVAITPLYLVFSTGEKTADASIYLSKAVDYSSSYLAMLPYKADENDFELFGLNEQSEDDIQPVSHLHPDYVFSPDDSLKRDLKCYIKVIPLQVYDSKRYFVVLRIDWKRRSGGTLQSYSVGKFMPSKDSV